VLGHGVDQKDLKERMSMMKQILGQTHYSVMHLPGRNHRASIWLLVFVALPLPHALPLTLSLGVLLRHRTMWLVWVFMLL
jgi:hypothetical protein